MTVDTVVPPSSSAWSIPLSGLLCEGLCVEVGWPEAAEPDAITTLRNRAAMRRQFLDSRPIDPVRNRAWLLHGMDRPYEAMLAIRMKLDRGLVGAIGWSHGNPDRRTLEIWRVMG